MYAFRTRSNLKRIEFQFERKWQKSQQNFVEHFQYNCQNRLPTYRQLRFMIFGEKFQKIDTAKLGNFRLIFLK